MLKDARFYYDLAHFGNGADNLMNIVESQVADAAMNGCYSCRLDSHVSKCLIEGGRLPEIKKLGFEVVVDHVQGELENIVEVSW